jgi:hypothetical protein
VEAVESHAADPHDGLMPNPPETYASYDGFLKTAIKRYWGSEKASKVDSIAMLLATWEAWEVAWDDATAPGKGATWLKGAAGVAGVTLLLRAAAGGPLGLLLAGASVASLVGLYSKHSDRIWGQVDHYRAVVDKYRPMFDEINAELIADRLQQQQRDLMVDGLLARLIDELDQVPGLEEPNVKESE